LDETSMAALAGALKRGVCPNLKVFEPAHRCVTHVTRLSFLGLALFGLLTA
jgi:hypothetical protein